MRLLRMAVVFLASVPPAAGTVSRLLCTDGDSRAVIFLADDHGVVREGLKALVNGAPKRIRVCTSCIKSGKIAKA